MVMVLTARCCVEGIRLARVVEQVCAEEGRLTLSETLRHRVTYFALGVALGSRGFVDEFFVARREQFDVRRKHGARAP